MGYPYWLVVEYLAPIIEFFGILWFIFLLATGRLNLPFFLDLFVFVYFFAVSISIWSVLFEEITFHKYEKRRDVLRLIGMAFLEPIFYHPLVMFLTVKGNFDKLLNRNNWGRMERKGFKKS